MTRADLEQRLGVTFLHWAEHGPAHGKGSAGVGMSLVIKGRTISLGLKKVGDWMNRADRFWRRRLS